jgi:LacI family transcriptional regulator
LRAGIELEKRSKPAFGSIGLTGPFGFVLQQSSMPFHQALGEATTATTAALSDVRGRARIEHCKELRPELVADRLEKLGACCDAVAVAAADHPLITRAIDRLAERGVPVLAAISDLSAENKRGFVGVDDRKLGRTAAWFVTQTAVDHGPFAILARVPPSHRSRGA